MLFALDALANDNLQTTGVVVNHNLVRRIEVYAVELTRERDFLILVLVHENAVGARAAVRRRVQIAQAFAPRNGRLCDVADDKVSVQSRRELQLLLALVRDAHVRAHARSVNHDVSNLERERTRHHRLLLIVDVVVRQRVLDGTFLLIGDFPRAVAREAVLEFERPVVGKLRPADGYTSSYCLGWLKDGRS